MSEDGSIARFHPRPSPRTERPVVWAIAESHLPAYLLPRDCPRITFYADAGTTEADRLHFLGPAARVLVIEQAWFASLCTTPLFCYELPPATFSLIDGVAGYFTSRVSVEPLSVTRVDRPILALLERAVELRFLPSLWPLREAVVASTLAFSIIRLRPPTVATGTVVSSETGNGNRS